MGAVKGDPDAQGGSQDAKVEQTKHAITIRFTDADELVIKIKQSTKFEKVYKAVADNRGMAMDAFRLNFDGMRIEKHDTPLTLEMGEEENIDCHIAQVGGGSIHV